MSSFAGFFTRNDLEASLTATNFASRALSTCLLQSIGEVTRFGRPYSAQHRFHLVQKVQVRGIRGVVRRELNIVQEGKLGPGLENAIHLLCTYVLQDSHQLTDLRKLHRVDGVGQHLHLVQGIEAVICEGQWVVEVSMDER